MDNKIQSWLCVALCVISSFFVSVNASNSIFAGFSPYGFQSVRWNVHGKYNADYNKSWDAMLSYEYQSKGWLFAAEINYGQSNLESISSKEEYAPHISDFSESLKHLDFALYGGYSFFPTKRFQLPVYIGASFDYLMGDPYDDPVTLSLATKARLKFYLSNRFGVFVGITYRIGVLLEKNGGVDYRSNISLFSTDAGFVLSF